MKILLICLSVLLHFGSVYGDDEIKIGVVLPLSGNTSNYGTEALKGINLAVENINRAGGIRRNKLKLIVKDNAGDPATTSRVVLEMIDEQQAMAIIGPITSTNSAVAAAVAQQASTPLILPTATNPYITEIGEYITRICFTDPVQSKALAEFSKNHLHAGKIAVVFEKGSSYSEKLSEFYVMRLKDIGGNVAFIEGFESGEDNIRDVISRALKVNPDLIFAPVYYPEAATIVNYIAGLNNPVTVLGGDGWESPELFRLCGKNMSSLQVFISSHFSLQNPHQIVSSFVNNFQQVFGNRPNSVSALGFDAVGMFVDGLKRASLISKNGLQQALISTSNLEGVTGTISMNEKRNAVKDIYILKASEDEFILETNISTY
ncbi:MAG: ABC transporter substrate-binding protein [candidate division Zixibacteria bacterium]